MKETKKTYLLITFLSVLTYACSIFSGPPIEPAPITPEVAPQENIEAIPPTALPSSNLPIGIVTENDGLLSFFDREGYTLLQVDLPGISYVDQSNIHIAGPFYAGGTNLPILYFSFEQNNSLMLNNNGEITTLLSTPNFSGLVGAPGQDVVAYTTTEFSGESLISELYLGKIQSIPIAGSVLQDSDPQGWGIVALAVDVEEGNPIGVWYSKRPWGIGGDIVFHPRRTLSYLDLRSGTSSQYLGLEANPSAISADRKWLAYTNDEDAVAGFGSMTIHNIATGENFSFPLQNAVDQRGAGAASISPNNQYLAWMEGNGWKISETPNFHSVVRVGDMSGKVVAEFADMVFLPTSGLGTVQRVEPVGWFDDNTLVVMARGDHWDDAVLVMVEISTQGLSILAKGAFAGFVYP